VFIACARLLGVPTRYVSGYAYSGSREQVASHAWAEAWVSNRWISFDVSRTREVAGGYIKLAVGRDYLDACPVRGIRLGGGEEVLSTRAQVVPQ
jgi:transglutaminase-like putative cysteine protease